MSRAWSSLRPTSWPRDPQSPPCLTSGGWCGRRRPRVSWWSPGPSTSSVWCVSSTGLLLRTGRRSTLGWASLWRARSSSLTSWSGTLTSEYSYNLIKSNENLNWVKLKVFISIEWDLFFQILRRIQMKTYSWLDVSRTIRLRKDGEERKVIQFHYTEWPCHSNPFSNALLEFRRRVRQVMNQHPETQDGPVIVHCKWVQLLLSFYILFEFFFSIFMFWSTTQYSQGT